MKAIEVIRPGQAKIKQDNGDEMVLEFNGRTERVVKLKQTVNDQMDVHMSDAKIYADVCADGTIILIDPDMFMKNLRQSAGWKKAWADIDAMGREISAKAMAQIEVKKAR